MKRITVVLVIFLAIANLTILINSYVDGDNQPIGNTWNIQDWSIGMDINNVTESSFIGEQPHDKMHGYASGDVNGDGHNDFILISHYNDNAGQDTGKVYLFFGSEISWSKNLSAENASVVFTGEHQGDMIWGLGGEDLNGDGMDEVLIMAPYSDAGGNDCGKIYIVFGRPTEEWPKIFNLSDADASYYGESSDEYAGNHITGPGDITGDGIEDLLIASKYNSENGHHAGQVYVIYGKKYDSLWKKNVSLAEADASFLGEQALDGLGYSGGGLSDINNDGLMDVLIGTNPSSNGDDRKGKIYVVFGKEDGWDKDTLISDAAGASFIEERAGDGFKGNWVRDVNGDGIGDLIIGSQESDEYDSAGKSYIFFGNESGWDMNTAVENADVILYCRDGTNQPEIGGAPSIDVNGDGIDDLIYRSPFSDKNGKDSGQIYIIFGFSGIWKSQMDLTDADVSILGEKAGDHFGSQIQPLRDINGDGYDDILVSANTFTEDAIGEEVGKVYLIHGRPTLGNPPEMELDEEFISSQLNDGVLSGDLEIKWNATDKEDIDNLTTNLSISISYRTLDTAWTQIVHGIQNNGSYTWNTTDPRIPDGLDYLLMIKVTDSTNKIKTKQTSFTFEIDNPDPPKVDISFPLSMDILKGPETIIWDAFDDEDHKNDLVIDIEIWGDGGAVFEVLEEGIANIGYYMLETPDFPDGNDYHITITVTDSTGLSNSDMMGPLTIFNTPGIEIFLPDEDEVLSGVYKVRWNALDPSDLKGDLTIDIWLIYDGGNEIQIISNGLNTGEFEFNTTQFPNGENYRIRLIVKDPTGLNSETMSGNFTIWNKNPPKVLFTYPLENSLQTGIFTITWDATDIEDVAEDLTFVLYYKLSGTDLWRELAYNILNTGSLNVDTRLFVDGDGTYSFLIRVRDPDGMISESEEMSLNVYNPDAPVIRYPEGPSLPVRDGTAEFTWTAEDPDPGETEQLRVWIYISTDGVEWIPIAEEIENDNSYVMDVTGIEDGSYFVKIKVADMQEGEDYRETEAIFPDLMIVNNINDAPVIEIVGSPEAGIVHRGEVSFNWTGFDADGDIILYTLYYKERNDTEWKIIPGAENIRSTSFLWNISNLEDGNYQVKIVGVEDYEDSLSMERITNEFIVEKETIILGDEDREVTINYGLLFGVGAGFVILALVVIYIMFMSVSKKKEDEEYEEEEFEMEMGLGKEDQPGALEDKEIITPEVNEDLEGAPLPSDGIEENLGED